MSMTIREPGESGGHASAAPVAPSGERPPPGAGADAVIVAALMRGEIHTALELCVERHAASIGRLCMAMLGSQHDADQVTEQTLLAAHDGIRDFRGEGSLRAWLCGIARTECEQRLQQRSQSVHPSASSDGEAALGDARRGARARRARTLLDRLSPSERESLVLRFVADLGFEDVAAASGVDEPTARERVAGALLSLRQALESEHDAK